MVSRAMRGRFVRFQGFWPAPFGFLAFRLKDPHGTGLPASGAYASGESVASVARSLEARGSLKRRDLMRRRKQLTPGVECVEQRLSLSAVGSAPLNVPVPAFEMENKL